MEENEKFIEELDKVVQQEWKKVIEVIKNSDVKMVSFKFMVDLPEERRLINYIYLH